MSSPASPARKRLNSRQIEVFRTVMITGSLTGAALQLRVAQPSLSRMMKRIEDIAGFPLFERAKGRLLPTAEARQLFASVEHIQAQIDGLGDVIDQIGKGGAGLFRFGASPSVGRHLAPAALAELRLHFPQVRIHFDMLSLTEVVDYLALGVGECFLGMTPILNPAIDSRALGPGRLVCLLPSAHPLAARTAVSAPDLVGQPLIMCEAGTPHGRLVQTLFDELGAVPTISVVARFAELAIGLTAAGLGIAVVDEFTAMRAASADLVVRDIEGPPRFQVHVSRRKDRTLSLFGRAFERVVADILRDRSRSV